MSGSATASPMVRAPRAGDRVIWEGAEGTVLDVYESGFGKRATVVMDSDDRKVSVPAVELSVLRGTSVPLDLVVRVRPAFATDVEWLAGECACFAQYHGAGMWPGEAEARALLAGMVAAHFCAVAEVAGERAGFLLGATAPTLWNARARVCQELLWWVSPAYRGLGVGEALLESFERHADRSGHRVALTTLADRTPVPKAWLEARGYRVQEVTWLRAAAPREVRDESGVMPEGGWSCDSGKQPCRCEA